MPTHERDLLPRTSRRREAGWDSTMFQTTIESFHVPNSGAAKWTQAPVVHYNINDGQTMILWRAYFEDRAQTAYVTLPDGGRYMVLYPYYRDWYPSSSTIDDHLGLPCTRSNLLVNMRKCSEERDRAWEVTRRFIVGDVDLHGHGSPSSGSGCGFEVFGEVSGDDSGTDNPLLATAFVPRDVDLEIEYACPNPPNPIVRVSCV
ncbi:hypothetical protein PENSPDRAFT_670082 [Peniophora sp. CONT]|nr:hypothetical protein PENSPDRAFT_670082 [Peniophora sp. CONT]